MSDETEELPGGDFRMFATRLSIQGLLACGVLENPITGRKQVNLETARMVFADLAMLREKTSGNLEPSESEHLDKVVRDLGLVLRDLLAQQ